MDCQPKLLFGRLSDEDASFFEQRYDLKVDDEVVWPFAFYKEVKYVNKSGKDVKSPVFCVEYLLVFDWLWKYIDFLGNQNL